MNARVHLAPYASVLAALSVGVVMLGCASLARCQIGGQASQANTRSLTGILESISQKTGIVALADSSLAGERLSPAAAQSAAQTTIENVEEQMRLLARVLPTGTECIQIYLPVPGSGRWDGDAVGQFALAQARYIGRRLGGDVTPRSIEILGQQLPEDKGREVAAAMHLKHVFLLTNPGRRAVADGTLTQAQLQRFHSMDANTRAQFIMNLHDQIEQQSEPLRSAERALWDSLPVEDRLQLKQTIGNMNGKGGKGGGGGGG